jgi:hypothetical protein
MSLVADGDARMVLQCDENVVCSGENDSEY